MRASAMDWLSFRDTQGVFLFDDVPLDTPLKVWARSHDFVPSNVDFSIEDGADLDGVCLRLKRGCTIEGTVTDSAGAPVEGAVLAFSYPCPTASSDIAGRFVLHGIPEFRGVVMTRHP